MTIAKTELSRQDRAPKPGMTIEPVTTCEELPMVTLAARAQLAALLARGEADRRAGRGRALSGAALKAEMRSSFEKITGVKVP